MISRLQLTHIASAESTFGSLWRQNNTRQYQQSRACVGPQQNQTLHLNVIICQMNEDELKIYENVIVLCIFFLSLVV